LLRHRSRWCRLIGPDSSPGRPPQRR
jgi:hypothetical protein